MSGQIICKCGAVLVDEVTEEGVRPLDSDELLPFRRTTDYVLCASCMRAYNARDLIAQAADADVISLLERLAEQGETQSG